MKERGQLVLVAAVLVAVALAPVVLAYLQLGYHDDVRAASAVDDPTGDTVRVLDRAVTRESESVPGTYPWTERSAAVTAFREDLEPVRSRLQTAEIERGTVTEIEYNATAASTWQSTNCPSGPGREFGPCRTDRGVVVQDRVGRTHVLAVGVDVTTTTDQGETEVTVVLKGVGG
ncbi:hypothetical protein EGH22_08085 [Halomicroarcula sp. F28]|uniref:DUF7261 family protein n=1 Tax=Haloarcula salinisoli TaxID=2487746 RepID=UPI001C738E92|nr:hypothetical protein [Halomicroarcula salinisoli]MBX0286282.1 hypothetical protein [Halomicroarcula salinisoli]